MGMVARASSPYRGIRRFETPGSALNGSLVILFGHVPTPIAHPAVVVGRVHFRPWNIVATTRTFLGDVFPENMGLKHIILLFGQCFLTFLAVEPQKHADGHAPMTLPP
jgi:hypothetical protein